MDSFSSIQSKYFLKEILYKILFKCQNSLELQYFLFFHNSISIIIKNFFRLNVEKNIEHPFKIFIKEIENILFDQQESFFYSDG